jgi:hypothetical protein
MRKKSSVRKLRVDRDTIQRLTTDDASQAQGGVLCSKCDTTCASCDCNRTTACTSTLG